MSDYQDDFLSNLTRIHSGDGHGKQDHHFKGMAIVGLDLPPAAFPALFPGQITLHGADGANVRNWMNRGKAELAFVTWEKGNSQGTVSNKYVQDVFDTIYYGETPAEVPEGERRRVAEDQGRVYAYIAGNEIIPYQHVLKFDDVMEVGWYASGKSEYAETEMDADVVGPEPDQYTAEFYYHTHTATPITVPDGLNLPPSVFAAGHRSSWSTTYTFPDGSTGSAIGNTHNLFEKIVFRRQYEASGDYFLLKFKPEAAVSTAPPTEWAKMPFIATTYNDDGTPKYSGLGMTTGTVSSRTYTKAELGGYEADCGEYGRLYAYCFEPTNTFVSATTYGATYMTNEYVHASYGSGSGAICVNGYVHDFGPFTEHLRVEGHCPEGAQYPLSNFNENGYYPDTRPQYDSQTAGGSGVKVASDMFSIHIYDTPIGFSVGPVVIATCRERPSDMQNNIEDMNLVCMVFQYPFTDPPAIIRLPQTDKWGVFRLTVGGSSYDVTDLVLTWK